MDPIFFNSRLREANQSQISPLVQTCQHALEVIANAVHENSGHPQAGEIVSDTLNGLCGESGHAEIVQYQNNLQVKLLFPSDARRRAAMEAISLQCLTLEAPCSFQKQQLGENDHGFLLHLGSKQSIALLGLSTKWPGAFKQGKGLLKSVQDLKALPLAKLPDAFLAKLCTFLPIKDLGHLAQANNQFARLLANDTPSGKLVWSLVAEALKIALDSHSALSAKDQIKELVIELPEATVDLLNHKLIMKQTSAPSKFYDGVFEKYVPEGFFLFYYLGFGASLLLYREKGETQSILTPGRMGKESWEPGELEQFQAVRKQHKSFEIVEKQ